MNLRKDHSHEISNFTVNNFCERLGEMPSAFAVVLMWNSRVAKQLRTEVLLAPAAVGCTPISAILGNACLEYCIDIFSITTFSDGCLGSSNDEGRSEV